MRDDDRIIRDVENIPERAHREGRMAIQERELELVPLSGEPSIVSAAREARARIMGELCPDWKMKYAGRSSVMKPGLLFALKRKDAQFWFQHREYTPEEVFLSELFELEPIAGDSPLMADARLARYRLLWELLELRLKPEAVQMAAQALSEESPQFWYEHMNFSAAELVKLHFPDIQDWQTPSERGSYLLRGGVYLAISAISFLGFMAFLLEREAPNIVGAPCGLCAVVMFIMALTAFFSIRQNRIGKAPPGNSNER